MVEDKVEKNDRIIKAKIFGEKSKKQMSIRIPAKLIDLFKIDPKKDSIYWVVDGTKELSLKGQLVKGEREKDEKTN